MPAFVKALTFAQFLHLAGLGAVTALTATGTVTVTEGLPIIAGLIGIALPAPVSGNSQTLV